MMYVFFFLIIRAPPSATWTDTFFPYTPLFRSCPAAGGPCLLDRLRPALNRQRSQQPGVFRTAADFGCRALRAQRRHRRRPSRPDGRRADLRSEEHTSELQSLMRISYAVFCLKKNTHE